MKNNIHKTVIQNKLYYRDIILITSILINYVHYILFIMCLFLLYLINVYIEHKFSNS